MNNALEKAVEKIYDKIATTGEMGQFDTQVLKAIEKR